MASYIENTGDRLDAVFDPVLLAEGLARLTARSIADQQPWSAVSVRTELEDLVRAAFADGDDAERHCSEPDCGLPGPLLLTDGRPRCAGHVVEAFGVDVDEDCPAQWVAVHRGAGRWRLGREVDPARIPAALAASLEELAEDVRGTLDQRDRDRLTFARSAERDTRRRVGDALYAATTGWQRERLALVVVIVARLAMVAGAVSAVAVGNFLMIGAIGMMLAMSLWLRRRDHGCDCDEDEGCDDAAIRGSRRQERLRTQAWQAACTRHAAALVRLQEVEASVAPELAWPELYPVADAS